MTARDDLYSIASSDMPVTSDEVDEAIDAFAHELAERQRAALDDVMDRWFPLHQDALTELIDVIDPKAQRAATEGDST